MNGLALRISKGSGKKGKKQDTFSPLVIHNFSCETSENTDILCDSFNNSSTAEEQLTILKTILDGQKQKYDEDTVRFLVIIFFYAEAKHPVKCFLQRHITKTALIQRPFSESMASLILSSIPHDHTYKHYIEVVSRVATCIENFPAGVAAVKIVEIECARYLKRCLDCCVQTLREVKTLSPTEKNEIFNLAHLALRLLLYIVQKITTENMGNIILMFKDIRSFIVELMFDDDVPMDTKSVGGILYLSMHFLENGSDSWVDILHPEEGTELSYLLTNEASQLALYSAIATVVPVERLQQQTVDGEPGVIILVVKILAIAERSSSESIIILGVARTLLQISKTLDKVSSHDLGQKLVGHLLTFIWSHLEHYMDSVRHLTAQALTCIVRYCTRMKKEGNPTALNNLFAALASLDRSRKSYYVSLTSLTVEMGAPAVMDALTDVIRDVIAALSVQAVQASATTALETLLQKHAQVSDTETIYHCWIEPILSYVASSTLDSTVLNILESLLAKAVILDQNIMEYILPYIKQSSNKDLKCVLILLSAARRSSSPPQVWRACLQDLALCTAAEHALDETRILCLSLIVESPKTTEPFTSSDLKLVFHFLRYNVNAQSPNFRQLTLSLLKKFVKRFEDSYKVLRRQKDEQADAYLGFLKNFRSFCFSCLLQGANYSRRFVALQVLAWCEKMHLEGYQSEWKEEYVEKLLLHLEDSYENNKAFALEILENCPVELLQGNKYSISLAIEDIMRQASSLKPTDCTSAAYKLCLLRNKLPEYVLQGEDRTIAEPVTFALVQRLHVALQAELRVCRRSVLQAAARAPMYGLLHCIRHLMMQVDVGAISSDVRWTGLVANVISTCMSANAAVSCVVNNSSPEGHLPCDMGAVTDHGNAGGITLDDGRPVTAQMVLLCAWRSVKEVSLLLGSLSSLLSIAGEEREYGSLTPHQLELMGEHFTSLLAETKHRGAFEQAYVGFTKLLARLWRCRSPALHALPRAWLHALLEAIASGDKADTLCATRRSAGLPFMIQALVTTELEVLGNPKNFHHCMSTLLRLALPDTSASRESETALERRAHAANILRALFRHTALHTVAAPHAGGGLMAALKGFAGGSWLERNSSTLLFSALMVRIFGVPRSRHHENLCPRNKMTGRIFFLRYPQLYDYMLEKLLEVSNDANQTLRPSLYPILLLLGRLYPSSLEGTVSNLKLVRFVPLVVSCGGSAALLDRRLAARAVLPLISPEMYIPHLEAMFALICDKNIKRNYCHGILLQLVKLIDARPDNLAIDNEANDRLGALVANTHWLLRQAVGNSPCYLIGDEYVQVVNLLIWRFPTLITTEFIDAVENDLEELLFRKQVPKITSGRDVCLANALCLFFVILNKYKPENISPLVYRSIQQQSYEVVLTALNYLLILYGDLEVDSKFQEHLSLIYNKDVLKTLSGNPEYVQLLCKVLKYNKYLECTQKTLKVLTLEKDTEKYIVETKIQGENLDITDDVIINTLFDCIRNEHDNLTHIYLESLSNFVSKKLKESSISENRILDVIRVIFACSSSDNNHETRSVVVGFLEQNFKQLLRLKCYDLSEEDKFEYKATLYATTVTVLEDDDSSLRQRTSNVITKSRSIQNHRDKRLERSTIDATTEIIKSQDFHNTRENPEDFVDASTMDITPVISTKASELLLRMVRDEDSIALFVVLGLLDFRSEVCMNDDVSDECRVFDQNERYNIYLEETFWTHSCAQNILDAAKSEEDLIGYVQALLRNPVYIRTIEKLCNDNVILFQRMVDKPVRETVNPKIGIFIGMLRNRNKW